MIKGLMDSGRRMVYAYTGGIDRSAEGIPYEFPGAMNDTTKGIGRIAKRYFNSKDQLVTLGFGGGPGPAVPDAEYTGWQLARAFGASLHNHNVGGSAVVINAASDSRNGQRLVGRDLYSLHAVARRTDCPDQLRCARISQREPVESVGHLARPWRACIDSRSD